MNPFSYVVQAVAGFSIGFLLLRPDTILPSNKQIKKWPHDVPIIRIEESASSISSKLDQRRVIEKREMKVVFTSLEMKMDRGAVQARAGHQWGISSRAKVV